MNRCLVMLHSLALLAIVTFAATRLPDEEVRALYDAARVLGKTDWSVTTDPCRRRGHITCSCSTRCHVTSIVLKGQNLTGKLPPELIRLPYLQEIDLSRNYLNGTIPPEWGSLPLVNISLLGNRLTGSIPIELASITTLKSLVIDFNNFSGGLPAKLGNLPSIERMLLNSNNFTGELPETFERLTTLKDFEISDNYFSGKIPDFIQNWTTLEKLVIQASGLTGPIPSGISLLTRLSDLRITDLSGPESSFPTLNKMKELKILMLRSCNIRGQLPLYLGYMKTLKTLDLSFNKIIGQIPNSFAGLANVDYMFLTGNMLNGSVPEWLEGDNIDLSYNNFSIRLEEQSCEPQHGVNLFASISGGNHSAVACLNIHKCPKTWYSLHINCGGSEVLVDKETYDEDRSASGPSSFYLGKTNWALSSTGYFPDDGHSKDHFTLSNTSLLSMMDPRLYMTARLSAISVTYYGFCLGSGNYTVSLHFAEIIFSDDHTYSSLGRRLFDVYIQGMLVLRDFNIAKEAGGAGKAVVKKFTASVTSSTLEIRLCWAGKGTTGIPFRGVYGPLISAISVDPEFVPPKNYSPRGGSSISIGVVIGIVVGLVSIILLICGILWWGGFLRLRREKSLEQDLKGVDLQTGRFTWRQIKDATNNFDIANKIGEGGFGPVYRGLLSNGTSVAVKQLSAQSKQGNREFLNEIGIISALRHPNLVKLHGCCVEGDQLLLIYEYMENNSLARALWGPEESQLELDWPTRQKICLGIARGLAYLHEESRMKIIHRDIKATNVLLGEDLFPKISDFGIAKLDEGDKTHIDTQPTGTYGYMSPEYAMYGHLSDRADVYSFGIVILEIVSGRRNNTCPTDEEGLYLIHWARRLLKEERLLDLVDPRLAETFDSKDMMIAIKVALVCSDDSAANRPVMSSVVSMLEGKTPVPEMVSTPLEDEYNTRLHRHFESLLHGDMGGITEEEDTLLDLGERYDSY